VVSQPANLAKLLQHAAAAGTGVCVGGSGDDGSSKGMRRRGAGGDAAAVGVSGGEWEERREEGEAEFDDTFGGKDAQAPQCTGSAALKVPSARAVRGAGGSGPVAVIDVLASRTRRSMSSSGGCGSEEASSEGAGGSSGSSGSSGKGSSDELSAVGAHARPRGGGVRRWVGTKERECSVLYWRAFTNIRREPRLLLLHLLVAVVLGVVVGSVFFKLGNTQVRVGF